MFELPKRGAKFDGNPCRKCGETLRYVSTLCCVRCFKASNAAWKRRNPDKIKAMRSNPPGQKPLPVPRDLTESRRLYLAEGRRRTRADWRQGEHERAEAAWAVAMSCDCCGSLSPLYDYWHSDHDHRLKLFRGILCHPCNIRLGYAEGSSTIQMSSQEIAYITRFTQVRAEDIAKILNGEVRENPAA